MIVIDSLYWMAEMNVGCYTNRPLKRKKMSDVLFLHGLELLRCFQVGEALLTPRKTGLFDYTMYVYVDYA